MKDEKENVAYLSMKSGRIGIIGLQGLLKEAEKRTFLNDDELATFLLEGVKERNYVPPSCEEEYFKVLLREYKRFTGSLEGEDESGDILEIKILGPGCPNCQKLEQEVMVALAEMQQLADVEHVREPDRIGEYGVAATPALVVNKRVKSVGKVLIKEEIKRLLNEELRKKG